MTNVYVYVDGNNIKGQSAFNISKGKYPNLSLLRKDIRIGHGYLVFDISLDKIETELQKILLPMVSNIYPDAFNEIDESNMNRLHFVFRLCQKTGLDYGHLNNYKQYIIGQLLET